MYLHWSTFSLKIVHVSYKSSLRMNSLHTFLIRCLCFNRCSETLFHFTDLNFYRSNYQSRAKHLAFSTNCARKPLKKLFTPGPLSVSQSTKEAMIRDVGSRDSEFLEIIKFIRHRVLDIAGSSSNCYTTVLLQGSGTYAVEAALQTTAPCSGGNVLILANGAYGFRMDEICVKAGIAHTTIKFPERRPVAPDIVEKALKEDNSYTTVAIVHCETSTGIINPVTEVGQLVKLYCPGTLYIVDAMSSFGALPLNMRHAQIDFLVSSANKCLEGVPGFAFVIASLKHLLQCKGNCRSHSLDLVNQYEFMEKTGQFRFTPPTHTLLAFHQALLELEKEGGVLGRARRYRANCEVLREGMKKFGFLELIPDNKDGYIITSYLYPKDDKFDFTEFYYRLNDMDQIIYPGKVTDADSFRIGNIGHIYPDDVIQLLLCLERVCRDMGMSLPVTY